MCSHDQRQYADLGDQTQQMTHNGWPTPLWMSKIKQMQ